MINQSSGSSNGDRAFKEEEWIIAERLYDLIVARCSDVAVRLESIAIYLRQETLEAYATSTWISDEIELNRAWRSRPDGATSEFIPARYWRFDKNLSVDIKYWRWKTSSFAMTKRRKPKQRLMMKGVHFRKDQVEQLFPDVFNVPTKSRVGRNPAIEARDGGWLAMLALILEGELITGSTLRLKDIELALQERLKKPEKVKGLENQEFLLGKNQIQQIASQTLKLLQSRASTSNIET